MSKINLNPTEVQEFVYQLKILERFFNQIYTDYDNMQQKMQLDIESVRSQNQIVLTTRLKKYSTAVENHSDFLRNISDYKDFSLYKDTINGLNAKIKFSEQQLEETKNIQKYIETLNQQISDVFRFNKSKIEEFCEELSNLINKSFNELTVFLEYVIQSNNYIQEINNFQGNNTTYNSSNALKAKTSAISPNKTTSILTKYHCKNTVGKRLDLCYINNLQNDKFSGLNHTRQEWHEENGVLVFNNPVETGKKLDSQQGKLSNYLGTCGCVSCVNILRLAGINVTEQSLVSYAAFNTDESGKPLCTTGNTSEENGATSYIDRQKILYAYGLDSSTEESNIENIFKFVSEGKGVIVSVHADFLYNKKFSDEDHHAVTITSVKTKNGKPYSVFVCDSNGMPNQEYLVDSFKFALTGKKMNVTKEILR